MSAFWNEVETKVEQMRDFECKCQAIAERHKMRDCTPMHQRVNRYGETVYCVTTVGEARNRYPAL